VQGQVSITEDSLGNKWFNATTAAVSQLVATQINNGYGTYVFWLRQSTGASWAAFDFAINDPALAVGTGYRVRIGGGALTLVKMPAATVLFTATNAFAAATTYLCAVTKSNAGVMTVYVRINGVWVQPTAATGSNPVTNTDYSLGNLIRAYMGEANARVGSVKHLPIVLTLDQLKARFPQ
jgi:hypothetical protein